AASGTTGKPVVITGDHFETAKQVFFGTTPATFVADGYKKISAIAPAGAGTVDVTVVNANGTSEKSSADQFAYTTTQKAGATPGSTPGSTPESGATTQRTVVCDS